MFFIMDLCQTCKRAFLLALAALFCAALFPFHAFAAEEADTTLFTLPVSTKLTGSPGDPAAFTIKIEPVGDAPAPVENTVTIKGAGRAEFKWASASATHTGRFEYVVSQQNDGTTYYTYDNASYKLYITVKYDATKGGYTATSSAYKTTDGQTSTVKSLDIDFSNSYYRPSSGRPSNPTPTPSTSTPDPESDEPDTPVDTPSGEPDTPSAEPAPETPIPEDPAEEPTATPDTTEPIVTIRPTAASTETTASTAATAPKTGDDTNDLPWVALLSVCALGAAGCALYLGTKKHPEQ